MSSDPLSEAREALRRIRDHRGSDECHAIFVGDCAEVMEEIARAALVRLDAAPAPERISGEPSGLLREARDYLRGMRRVADEDGLENMAEACGHVISLIAKAAYVANVTGALQGRGGVKGWFYPEPPA